MNCKINQEINSIQDSSLKENNNSTFYNPTKIFLDKLFSLTALILLSPILIIIAVIIKIDSKGPIIYKQKRVGKNQKLFTIYKFRTMEDHADQKIQELIEKDILNTKTLKANKDPRVTWIGGKLRKYSIDEIPQFFNVIIGNMSLVGPRPPSKHEVDQYEKDWYFERFKALPGITGLWQVSGRNRVSFERRMELDYRYVQKRSLLFDIKIMLKTIPAILRCEVYEKINKE